MRSGVGSPTGLRFALSVLGNTLGGAVLLAGAFSLPSVLATLASLLIA